MWREEVSVGMSVLEGGRAAAWAETARVRDIAAKERCSEEPVRV